MRYIQRAPCRALLCLSLFFAAAARAQTPHWIWSSRDNNSSRKEVRFFRKTFTIRQPISEAELAGSGDDRVEFFINGKKVATVEDWKKPANVDVTKELVMGENVIAARCENEETYAGLIAQLEMTIPDKGSKPGGPQSVKRIVSDSTWFWSDREASELEAGRLRR